MITPAELEAGYRDWAEELVAEGYRPQLLTFMFRPMRGSFDRVAGEMLREVERVYARHLTRVVRKPNALAHLHERPVWLCCLDRPVFKHVKSSLQDATVNDGLHVHAAAFYWPRNRLGESVLEHFEAHCDLYVVPDTPLDRIDVEPITHRVDYVVEYVLKSIRSGLVGDDAMLILPAQRITPLRRPRSQTGAGT